MHSVRQKLEMELNMEKRRRDEADKVFSDILKRMTEFVTQHKSQLETHSHGMISTSNFLLMMAKLMSGGNVGALVGAVETFLRESEIALIHLDILSEEQNRCMKLLGSDITKRTTLSDYFKDKSFDKLDESGSDTIKLMELKVQTLQDEITRKRIAIEQCEMKILNLGMEANELRLRLSTRRQ